MPFPPNAEQIKSAIRWFVTTFGGVIAGWFAAKGYFTVDQVVSVLNSPVLISAVASGAVFIWSLVTHTQSNAIAVANNVPDVAGVVMKDTVVGKAMAADNPSPTVAVAGSQAAAQVAEK